MNSNGVKIRNIICAVLSVILAVLLAYLFCRERQQEKLQSALVEALQAEASSYEEELQELRAELSDLEKSVSYSSEETEIMVGFLLSEVSDLTYIKEIAQTYDFSPVLVIDCTAELEEVEEIIDSADVTWEIMLYASNYSEKVNDNVLSVLSYLKIEHREHTGVFFLRDDDNTASNVQLLIDDGFIGYTSYHEESPIAGQTEDGIIYFDYSYLTTLGTSVTSRLTSLYSSKSSLIVIFDMASIDSGGLSEAYVTSLLNIMQTYAEKEDCSFSTVADVVEELSNVNAIEAENQADYEAQVDEIQERIEELKEMIAAIYDKLE